MSEALCAPCRRPDGFTLIEVIGALVIFSVGVLMVIRLSTALGSEMNYAATMSQIVVTVQERMDSLEAQPFDSLTVGTSSTVVSVRGTPYTQAIAVTLQTALLKEMEVSMTPASSGHPSYTATSYMANNW